MMEHNFKTWLIELLRQGQHDQNTFFTSLPETELAANGEPERWAAKDHVVHMTFWRQRTILRLRAHLYQEPKPEHLDFEQVNPIVFEENRHRTWPDILTESDQVCRELYPLIEQISEEDLQAVGRFDWMGTLPLYIAFMGNHYEHIIIHLGYYLLDRNNEQGALEVYETWTNRAVTPEAPATLKGYLLYNLACFYALHDRLDQAETTLQQSLEYYPPNREYSLTDPDFAALRARNTLA